VNRLTQLAVLGPLNLCVAGLAAQHAFGQDLALRLDGVDDGMEVGGGAVQMTNAYTFEAWVLWESGATVILRKDGWDYEPYHFAGNSAWMNLHVNWRHFVSAGTGCSNGNGNLQSNNWAHLAASFDGSTLRFYRNGMLVGSCWMPQPTYYQGEPLHIGYQNSPWGGTAFMKGWLDEVRVWNVARSQAEIASTIHTTIDATIAASFPGLVACWNMDGSPLSATGSSHGGLVGGAAFGVPPTKPDLDCNSNGVLDFMDLAGGAAQDCNGNETPDSCDIASGWSADCDGNGVPDTCQVASGHDCNGNLIPDSCDIASGVSIDCNSNGTPDECENLSGVYCTAGTSVHGCVPSISGIGAPSSISGSGFDIRVNDLPGQRWGTIFYGFYPASTPWAPNSPSYRCVSFPIQRMGNLQANGGISQCNGSFGVDFNAWYAANPGALGSPFVPGQVFYAQGWYRDPAAPKQTNLSNALRFTLCN
jgi:hypothetical protein